MAEGMARLTWSQTSTAVARLLNAFRRRGGVPDDWLVPEALKAKPQEPAEEPVLLPVDVLIDVFCKKPPAKS